MKTIFELIQSYINNEEMPRRIKYDIMMDGYEYFYWDDNAEEYRCENDKDCYLSETPWHHLLDEVEIIGEDFDKDMNVPIKEDCLTCRYNQDDWDSEHCDGCSKAHSNYEPFVMYYPQVDGITPYVIIEGE